MENVNDRIVARFGAKGYLVSSPLVLFLAGITTVFGFLGGNDFYILLALTVVAVIFWLYYFLRLRAVYEDGVLNVRRPFGKRLVIKETDIAFVRKNRNRYYLYDKDGNELTQFFSYMDNAEKLVGVIEDKAAQRLDKRVLIVSEYLEPLNALLKTKCHSERFELTRAIDRSVKAEKADKHNLTTEGDTAAKDSAKADVAPKTESAKAVANTDNNNGYLPQGRALDPRLTAPVPQQSCGVSTFSFKNESIDAEGGESGNTNGEKPSTEAVNTTPVLRLIHKTDASKRILFYLKGRETHLKFLNTSVVLSTPDNLDEAVAGVFEVVEDIITSKIATVCVPDAKGRIVNSRAFYRKQTDRKTIKDAKLNKTGARVCAWNDKAARDFLNRMF